MKPRALLLLALAGCSPEPSLVLEMPSTEFRIADTPLVVTFVAVNRGSSSIWADACDSRVNALVERWDGLRWQQYSGGFCTGLSVPIEIPAGANRNGGAAIQRTGVFHFVVQLHNSPPGLAPTTVAVSAPFAVH